jgi:hypothetical protein
VSEAGFDRYGKAVMPDAKKSADLEGSDMAKWLKLSEADKKNTPKPSTEKWCTQEERQIAYDN